MFIFVWNFVIPMIVFVFAYWKILGVIRRQTKVTVIRPKITASNEQTDDGTSKTGQSTITGTTSAHKNDRAETVSMDPMPSGSTSHRQTEDRQQSNKPTGLSKAQMNVIRTMVYIIVCFVLCWLPTNVNFMYVRFTVS